MECIQMGMILLISNPFEATLVSTRCNHLNFRHKKMDGNVEYTSI